MDQHVGQKSFVLFKISLLIQCMLLSKQMPRVVLATTETPCDNPKHNEKAQDHDHASFTVKSNQKIIINIDVGTITICKQEEQDCTVLENVVQYDVQDATKTARFVTDGDINIYGELKLVGKRVISIESCYGNIVINTTNEVKVQCSDNMGKRTDCTQTKDCTGCTSYAAGGGGGGAGGSCGKNTRCPSAHAHSNANDTSVLLAGNPGCNYASAVAKGGGGIELRASRGKITIGSIIDASGVSSIRNCMSGAGGTIRLLADYIEIRGKGKLIANGGDIQGESHCSLHDGGTHGGGGGIIDIIAITSLYRDPDVTSVRAGAADCPGTRGLLLTKVGIGCQSYTIGAVEDHGLYQLKKARFDERVVLKCYYGPHNAVMTARCSYPWENAPEIQWKLQNKDICWTRSDSIAKYAENMSSFNILEVTRRIRNITNEANTFDALDVANISIILEKIARLESPPEQVSDDFYHMINNVMNIKETVLIESQEKINSSNRIIEALKEFSQRRISPEQDQPKYVNLKNIALVMLTVKSEKLSLVGNSSVFVVDEEEAVTKHRSKSDQNIFMEIRGEVFNNSSGEKMKVLFILYRKTGLFNVAGKENIRGKIQGFVVAAFVFGKSVTNLRGRAIVRYPSSNNSKNIGNLQCVHWSFQENLNLGDWSKDGCNFQRNEQDGFDECHCNHWENLAVLFGVQVCQSYTFGSLDLRGLYQVQGKLHDQRSTLKCFYGPPSGTLEAHCVYPWKTRVSEQWVLRNHDNCWLRSESIANFAEKITASNALKVSKRIRNMTSMAATLNSFEIGSVSTILSEIANAELVHEQVSDDFYNTVSNLLNANETELLKGQESFNSSSRIIEAVEKFSEKRVFPDAGVTKYVDLNNIAVSLSTVKTTKISAVADSSLFQVYETPLKPACPMSFSAALSLPKDKFPGNNSNTPKMIVILYRKTGFLNVVGQQKDTKRIESYVLAASVPGKYIKNFHDAITIRYPTSEDIINAKPQCVFWDFGANKNRGGWSEVGCKFQRNSQHTYECRCDHFTNFAMLLDIEPQANSHVHMRQKQPLSIISYVGCSLSLLGITLTILTLILFRELLANMPSKVILNICIALAAALSVFLAAAERHKTSSDIHCIAAGIMIHYFFLAALAWMTFEAYTMYFAFVKVLPKAQLEGKIPRFWTCCLICWGVPVVIVCTTAVVTLDSYRNDDYCLLQGTAMVGAFFVPVALCIPFNTITFGFILCSLLRSRGSVTSTNIRRGIEEARRGVAIAVFLGLTWIFGLLAMREAKIVFQYLFCIINSLQGWMIFIFYCVLSTEVRSKYQHRLCKNSSSNFKTDTSSTSGIGMKRMKGSAFMEEDTAEELIAQ